eukprot:3648521-Rhodomonas_salina.1
MAVASYVRATRRPVLTRLCCDEKKESEQDGPNRGMSYKWYQPPYAPRPALRDVRMTLEEGRNIVVGRNPCQHPGDIQQEPSGPGATYRVQLDRLFDPAGSGLYPIMSYAPSGTDTSVRSYKKEY